LRLVAIAVKSRAIADLRRLRSIGQYRCWIGEKRSPNRSTGWIAQRFAEFCDTERFCITSIGE